MMEIILFALFFAQKAPNFLCQMWNILQRMISRENNRFSVELSRSYFCTALPYQHVDQKIDFHRGFSRLSLDHIGTFQAPFSYKLQRRFANGCCNSSHVAWAQIAAPELQVAVDDEPTLLFVLERGFGPFSEIQITSIFILHIKCF